MATTKQRKALEKVLENKGNVSKSMREAGYSPKTAKNPKILTESKAWRELLDEYLPDDLILGALRDDIKKKPGNRKPELELATKLKGKLVDRTDITSGGEKMVALVEFAGDEDDTGNNT